MAGRSYDCKHGKKHAHIPDKTVYDYRLERRTSGVATRIGPVGARRWRRTFCGSGVRAAFMAPSWRYSLDGAKTFG